MRVLKFGGTSVANAERFLRVADILESNARQGRWPPSLPPPKSPTTWWRDDRKTISGQVLYPISAMPNVFLPNF